MEVHLFLRTLCIITLVCAAATIADSSSQGGLDSEEDFSVLMESLEKRGAFKKLRSHNPILIYHQSIQQPRYLPRISSLREEPVSGYDIPRRLIRRGSNKTHSNMPPLLVWNHQLLPNFYNKRQPPFFMSLRRDGYGGNLKNNPTVKRSGFRWLQSAKSYEETGKESPYEELSSQDNRDNYDEENDSGEFRLHQTEFQNGKN